MKLDNLKFSLIDSWKREKDFQNNVWKSWIFHKLANPKLILFIILINPSCAISGTSTSNAKSVMTKGNNSFDISRNRSVTLLSK
jgi:hypothetical protein